MSFQNFLTSLFSPSSRRRKADPTRTKKSGRGPRLLRPVLESLEDRTAPSFSPTDFARFGQKLEDGLVALQTPLNNLYAAGNTVPLLGNRLKDVAALNVFADPKLKGISEKLAAVAPTGLDAANNTALRNALFDILGPAGTNLIADRNVLVVTANSNSNTIAVRMPFNKNLSNVVLSGGFGLGLAGLPFSVTAAGGVAVSGNFAQTARFSFAAAANTAVTVTEPFNVTARASLVGGSNIEARIGFLQSRLVDNGSFVDVTFRGQAASPQVTFNARVKLNAEATFGGSKDFPSLAANFLLNWDTRANAGATPQAVRFDNVSVGLGEFLTDMLRPIIENVQRVTGPLQPVVDFLKTPVPGISDLAEAAGLGRVTIKDIIRGQQAAQGKSMDNQIEMALRLSEFIDTINGLDTTNGLKIGLGNLDLSGNSTQLINPGNGSNLILSGGRNAQEALGELGESGRQLKKLLNDAGGEIELKFPLLTDPVNSAFRLFVGQHADLVKLDLKYALSNRPQSEGSIFGIAFGFNGGLSVDARLSLGYDTYGIQRFIETGDPARLADGFYVHDDTHFRLSGTIGVFAGAGIVVFSISLEGGLTIPDANPLNITLNRDAAGNPDNDPTKLHFDEITAHPDRLFKASGQLDAGVNLVVTVGINVDLLGVEVLIGFTKTFEIAKVKIFDFSSSPSQSSFLGLGGGGGGGPVLAQLNSLGDLTLNMGPNVSKLRGPVAPVNGDEEFTVLVEGDKLWVLAYGVAQSFPRSSVKRIYADGGTGNDTIVIDESVALIDSSLDGGVGNDRLEHRGFFSRADMTGGDGDDVLVGGMWNETLTGGAGKDVLIGGDGNDFLIGNDGNDKLFGGLGDDVLFGGAGNDELDTGGGKDFAGGAEGADTVTIYPGIGSPTLDGGLGGFGDDSQSDKLIVIGTAGADVIDLERSGAGLRITLIDAQGRLDNPTAVGLEQIFIQPGKGADVVNINDLSGTVVKQVVANEKADNAADTVIVNGTNANDIVSVNETADLTPFYRIVDGVAFQEILRTAQQVQFLDAAGNPKGPSIWTPNIVGDQLVVNTFAGSDRVAITSDAGNNPYFVPPAGTVQVATGGGNDSVYVGSLSSATDVLGGAGDDTLTVGVLPSKNGTPGPVPGGVNAVRGALYFRGNDGNDLFLFDDTGNTRTGRAGVLTSDTRGIVRVGKVTGFGMSEGVSFGTTENAVIKLGSTGNVLTVADTPTTETRLLTILAGAGTDTVNVEKTRTSVFVDGQVGLDTVNIGSKGSTRLIGGPLTIGSVSAVNIDDSADPVGRTVLLYNRDPYNVISGLAPADINLIHATRNFTLSSLTIRAGSGGNAFRIHATPTSSRPGGVTTTVNTGDGSDRVLVTGLEGTYAVGPFVLSNNLKIDLQEGTNTVTVGSTTMGLDPVNGPIAVTGRGNSNALVINDRPSTNERDYVVGRNFVQRLDKTRIDFQNLNTLDLQTGVRIDRIRVEDTFPAVGSGSGTTINRDGGEDRIEVGRTTGLLDLYADGFGVIEVGNARSSLDNIRGGINVRPSFARHFVALSLNDQAATTPQRLDVNSSAIGTLFRRSGAANVNVFFSPLSAFEYLGGSGGNTVHVNASPATGGSRFMLGAGNDSFIVGDGLGLAPVAGRIRVDGQDGAGGGGFARVNDSVGTAGRTFTWDGNSVRWGTTIVEVANLGLVQVIGGKGNDNYRLNALGTIPLTIGDAGGVDRLTGPNTATRWNITSTNAGNLGLAVSFAAIENLLGGNAADTFVISAGASLDGSLDGGGGVNTLDYSTFNDDSLPTPVSFYDGEGNFLDSAGDNDGEAVGDVTFRPGRVGQAFNFDGVGDYVDLGNDVSLDLPGSTSVAMWVKLDSLNHYKFFLADFDPADGTITQGSLGTVLDASVFGWYQSYTDGTRDTLAGTTPIPLNRWFHLSVVRDDAAKTVKLYVNGVEEASLSYAGKNVVPLQGNKFLGGSGPAFPADFIDGQLDEVGIYNRALSPAEIQTLYSGPAAYRQAVLSENGLLTAAHNMAIAADGSIYVANSAQLAIPGSSGGILRIDPVTGAQTAVTTDGLLHTAVAVVVEADGNLAALDYSNGLVRVDSTTGAQTFVSDFRNPDQGPVLTYAIGLVVEPSGNYLVSDGPRDGIDGVYRIDRDTGFRTLVTSGGSLDGIYGLALEPTGQVVVINNGTINAGSVVRVDPTTGAQSVLASGFAILQSIAVAPDGSIFVTDAGNYTGAHSQVYRIDPVTGARSVVFTLASGSRYFSAIAIEPSGSIVVSESAGNFGGDLNNSIVRLDPPASLIGVVVNLQLGAASGLTGGIANIQNVIGSAGDDILVGNGGNVLTGGAGRDVLIAGASASILFGGGGDDLLIGGMTDYDRDAAALLAVRAEWARKDADYATRVANLRNGTNGAPSLNDTTVRANGKRNTLTGNAGRDLFFTNRNRDTLDGDPLTEEFVPIFVG